MADNKKYYYLKLKDNFFDSDAMIILESMPDGYLYSNILLKLYLRSLKFKGKLMFNEKIPYNPTILAQVTRHSVGVVEKAINIFKDLGLIDILDNGAIYMLDIQNFIGQSSTEADRKREYRKQIDFEKASLLISGQMSDKSTPDIERNIEKEKEKENYMEQNSKEILSNDFNFEILKNQIKVCYEILTYEVDYIPYTIDDYIQIFKYFYSSYKAFTGKEHPNIKNNHIKEVLIKLPFIQDINDRLSTELDPEEYKVIIEAYFKQPWRENINPTILHFISGNIRALRYYETIY